MLSGCTPWPGDTARTYRRAGVWRGETLGAMLRRLAAEFGRRTALVHGPRRITYAELDRWADRLAAGFAGHGIEPGQRVVVQLPNVPEFAAITFALSRLGAIPVFSLPAHRATEIRHLGEITEASAYVLPGVHRGFDHVEQARELRDELPALEKLFVLSGNVPADCIPLAELESTPIGLREQDPADVAFFLLSGGTTALPKLIPRTHDDYLYQSRQAAEVGRLTGDDVYLAALPIEFNFAWGCPGVLGTFHTGGTVVLADNPDPEGCFELIEREKVTFTAQVPSITRIWLELAEWTERDLSSLRLLQVGGARMTREFTERIGPTLGCQLQQVFGMAEGLLTFTRSDDPAESVLTTQGRPISPYDEMRVVGPAGEPCAEGEVGELLARGPYTLRGYYRAPEHNAKAFTPDGFYRTGDRARITEDGDLVIEGRIKEMIIRGGDKISATEVEDYLLAHPAVAAAAVVGIPDEFLSERVCAYVVAAGAPGDPSVSADELRSAVRDLGVAEYKIPERIEFAAGFPLTPLGKVDKKALIAMAMEGT
ncbi:(2,3-dihydroxybenzoyl)adenylate synthase [Amycolatopsis sp. EV170708-02-1]|uniref:(2,3-dihydroxybenzoyl)adenylate synthase n=1 Tax=Amycolatopsis sp. EV170708-02-1 TaxID=2919322 RepID=UPI001F0BE389|nr:AMP-binding protein [Amycolatopsis sp. EV170708-02-1]UMP07613.1 AMP-binding protein [Amycolatopsis sp. EV170708-02-1]